MPRFPIWPASTTEEEQKIDIFRKIYGSLELIGGLFKQTIPKLIAIQIMIISTLILTNMPFQ